MTTAIAFSAYSDPNLLKAIDVEEPQPNAGQIRVHVEAAGVQPFDTRVRPGRTSPVLHRVAKEGGTLVRRGSLLGGTSAERQHY
jgi:NADPH:quinone reductase-like Zn-dependent oxidoreductase